MGNRYIVDLGSLVRVKQANCGHPHLDAHSIGSTPFISLFCACNLECYTGIFKKLCFIVVFTDVGLFYCDGLSPRLNKYGLTQNSSPDSNFGKSSTAYYCACAR